MVEDITDRLIQPLPWRATPNNYGDGLWTVQDDNGFGVFTDVTEDEARFIVTACNAHYDLLEALKRLFEDYKRLADSGDAGNWALEDMNVGRQALAAIQKAEAQ